MKSKGSAAWMKAALGLATMGTVQSAMASYYYVIDAGSSDPNATQYASADEGCQAIYTMDAQNGSPFPDYPYLPPYAPPYLAYETAKAAIYTCNTAWQKTPGDTVNVALYPHGVTRLGNNCGQGTSYNQATGACEKKDDELDRVEAGDVSATVAGMCFVGDPINPAGGNVYEREVDYSDKDGVLVLSRVYNSRAGGWMLNVDSQVWFDRDGAAVVLPDGHTAIFTRAGDLYTGEPGERGKLTYSKGVWTYVADDETTYTYTMRGQLSGIRYPSGRFVSIVRDTSNPFAYKTTMTDDLAHSLVITLPFARLGSATIGGLTVSYTFDGSSRLAKVSRAWKDHAVSRQYLYEDTANPESMTGVVDERGIRIATWTYDAQNRATSSTMPLGAGQVTVAYNADGTATVSNALGHPVTYEYELINGGRRISAIHGAAVAGCPAANSTFTYTADGQMATQTNALGLLTAFSYDSQGRETSRIEAKGTSNERATTTTWDGPSFRPAMVTTSDRVTTYIYDPQGRLLSTQFHSIKE